MFDAVSPSDIVVYLQRIDPTVLVGRTPLEAWREFLKKNSGGSGSIAEMERAWMNSKGVTGNNNGKGNNDQVGSYMASKGFAGNRRDMIRAYLRGSAVQ